MRAGHPELLGLMALAGVLNLWALAINGWANEYYAAAARSMSGSWHDFLFASLDRSGVMTVDKPPLALWVQALSVRVFGYHSPSILVPQALMGVAGVALVYDLVRRRFGRIGGVVAGMALALTPITVAISRHNNPDALLVLCCVAAVWCAVRGLDPESTHPGRTRWLAAAGVCVGLGFETKMGVALTVVPGIAVAWLWMAPAARTVKGAGRRAGGRLHALRQLLVGGAAMAVVGGAWPLLVELTPAADRPWVSGTSDNRMVSLILEYNGVGRVDGQTGGPGGGTMLGSAPGPLRLLDEALGAQAGWLLGFALVSGVGILLSTRVRRSDARTGWLLAVGGAFVTTAVLFSAASGIFHPYYVSLLAPLLAALVGAGAAQLVGGGAHARVFGPLVVAGGVASELVVLGDYPGQLTWLKPVLVAVGVLAVWALAAFGSRRVRMTAMGAALAALLVAPAAWAVDTLGYATSGTFPQGGPASIASNVGGVGGARGGVGGPGGGFTGFGGRRAGGLGGPQQLFGSGGPPQGAPPSGPGGPFGGSDAALRKVLAYVSGHGGGTIAVSSQSSASGAIVDQDANVAGIGGFSGRESDVSVSWLAQEVRSGKIRWVWAEESGGGFSGRLPGDTRTGSKTAMAAVTRACARVAQAAVSGTGAGAGGAGSGGAGTLYDCAGRAAALARLSASAWDL